jgi:GntR family transcriptional regulator
MRRAGLVPSTELLGIELQGGGASLAVGGALHTLEGAFYLLRRLRYGGEFPVMLETRRISATAVPDLDGEDLTASLYEIYRKRGIVLARVRQAFRPVILDQAVLELFGLIPPAPGMLLEGASYDSTGRLLELERSFYRGDRYQFLVSAGSQSAGQSA